MKMWSRIGPRAAFGLATLELGKSIDELIIVSNSSGEFYTIWMIPNDLESGTYEIIATDTDSTSSSSLIIN